MWGLRVINASLFLKEFLEGRRFLRNDPKCGRPKVTNDQPWEAASLRLSIIMHLSCHMRLRLIEDISAPDASARKEPKQSFQADPQSTQWNISSDTQRPIIDCVAFILLVADGSMHCLI